MRRRLEAFRGELNLSSHTHCLDEQYRALEHSKTSNFVSQPNRTQRMLLCLRGRCGVGYSGVQRSCEYPHIPALHKNRLKLLEGFALFSLSPGYAEEPSGLGAPTPAPVPLGPRSEAGPGSQRLLCPFQTGLHSWTLCTSGKIHFPRKKKLGWKLFSQKPEV